MRFFKQKKIDWESEAYKHARFHYLLQLIYGESLAENYCRTMSMFAPTKEARDFLLQQQREEDMHLELLTDMVSHMERPHEKISKHLRAPHNIMDKALAEKDWPTAVMVQNFMIEGLAITLCQQQGKYGDELVHRVFQRILKDEVRHVAFGVQEIKKLIDADIDGSMRKKLIRVQRETLFRTILLFKDLAPDASKIGVQWDDLAEEIVREHVKRVEKAGLWLPLFDELFLKGAIIFLALI